MPLPRCLQAPGSGSFSFWGRDLDTHIGWSTMYVLAGNKLPHGVADDAAAPAARIAYRTPRTPSRSLNGRLDPSWGRLDRNPSGQERSKRTFDAERLWRTPPRVRGDDRRARGVFAKSDYRGTGRVNGCRKRLNDRTNGRTYPVVSKGQKERTHQ